VAVGTDDPPGPYSVGGRRLSETTVPVRVGSHKDVIGPGIVYVPNAPRSSTYHYLVEFAEFHKSRSAPAGIFCSLNPRSEQLRFRRSLAGTGIACRSLCSAHQTLCPAVDAPRDCQRTVKELGKWSEVTTFDLALSKSRLLVKSRSGMMINAIASQTMIFESDAIDPYSDRRVPGEIVRGLNK
jgi:hypothetical protein